MNKSDQGGWEQYANKFRETRSRVSHKTGGRTGCLESSEESTGEGECSEGDTKDNSGSAEEDEGPVDADRRGGGAGCRRRGSARGGRTGGLRLARSGGGYARRSIFDTLWCERGIKSVSWFCVMVLL